MKGTAEAATETVAGKSARKHAARRLNGAAHRVPLRIKTILVPLDFSSGAMEALDYATNWARKFAAHVHLVHVQAVDEACAVPGGAHVMRERAETLSSLHDKLAGLKTEHPPHFWPENCHIRSGRPAEEIRNLARELEVDLIVLGSRGRTGVRRVLLGSTAKHVIRLAPCPVLVVRQTGPRDATPQGLRIKKILVPTDFSPCSTAGARYAAFLARPLEARLHLLHVVRPTPPVVLDRASVTSPPDEKELIEAQREMASFSRMDFLRELKCETQVRRGVPWQEISSECAAGEIDLVVISSHGRTGFKHLLLGSVAEDLVRNVDCPTLVVPNRDSVSREETCPQI